MWVPLNAALVVDVNFHDEVVLRKGRDVGDPGEGYVSLEH